MQTPMEGFVSVVLPLTDMAGVAYSEPRPASLQYPTNVLAFSESALTVSSYVKMIEEDEGEALVVPKEDSLDNLLSVNS